MPGPLFRGIALCAALSLLVPSPLLAQSGAPAPAPAPAAAATAFNLEQLDAMLAPIALYPDALLAQVLMATTYPLQVVEAARWLEQGSNKQLTGDALAAALVPLAWDPSVKSLVPFPQVLVMMNSKLDWMQQVGYAVSTQQADVMQSVQRLRRQAQTAGTLATTEQQTITVTDQTIVIEPTNPQVVYVPSYNPVTAYGTWPYPSYPPVYVPPPVGYGIGSALVTGMAFATGVAVVGSLWGWASPGWGGGQMNVNVNRYNNINTNRAQINNSNWRAPSQRAGGLPPRPPGGPVGLPARSGGLPANAIGRPNVQVPANLVNHPRTGGAAGANRPDGTRPDGGRLDGNRPGGDRPGADRPGADRPGGDRPGAGSPGGQRPASGSLGGSLGGGSPGGAQRPDAGRPSTPQRPAAGGPASTQRPAQRPGQRPSTPQARPSAFGGVNDGARAGQYANRGAQSRQTHASRPAGGGRAGGGASQGGRGRGR